jgi:hypothetical protein
VIDLEASRLRDRQGVVGDGPRPPSANGKMAVAVLLRGSNSSKAPISTAATAPWWP